MIPQARTTPRRRPCGRRPAGLGLVELVISLAIAAMLLTAVAAAYAAATSAIEMNDQFFRASQAARVSINQIMSETRKAQSGVVGANSLEITPSIGEKRLYEYDAANQRITMTFPDRLVPPTHVLARNVQDVQFFTDGQTISMRVTIQIGPNQVTLSGSAMPRRTVQYN
jgi:type II secretory pathway pseudopilin PulG